MPEFRCYNCDTEIPHNSNYCLKCGSAVSPEAKEKEKKIQYKNRTQRLPKFNDKILFLETQISKFKIEILSSDENFKKANEENQSLRKQIENINKELENMKKNKIKDIIDKYLPITLIVLFFLVIVVLIIIFYR